MKIQFLLACLVKRHSNLDTGWEAPGLEEPPELNMTPMNVLSMAFAGNNILRLIHVDKASDLPV
jgi:hypothetical protein